MTCPHAQTPAMPLSNSWDPHRALPHVPTASSTPGAGSAHSCAPKHALPLAQQLGKLLLAVCCGLRALWGGCWGILYNCLAPHCSKPHTYTCSTPLLLPATHTRMSHCQDHVPRVLHHLPPSILQAGPTRSLSPRSMAAGRAPTSSQTPAPSHLLTPRQTPQRPPMLCRTPPCHGQSAAGATWFQG